MSLYEKLTNQLMECGKVSKTDADVVAYGMQVGAELILNVATTALIGFVLGMLPESILLVVGYMTLRSYTGGYHAETFMSCYIMSNLLIAILLVICKGLAGAFQSEVSILLICMACPAIYAMSPVQTPSKPLDDVEVKYYRKQSRIRILIELAVVILFLLTGLRQFALVLSLGMASIAVLMIVGIIKNQFIKGKEEGG